MAGNSLLNAAMISKEGLRILENSLGFAKGVNRNYDDSFAQSGAKIGSVMNIRKPTRFTVTSGAALNIQDVADQSIALTLDTQNHVGFQFTSKELTLNIDEFGKRYLNPAIASLANKIDADGMGKYVDVANSVGTPGTTPNTALLFLQAGQKLDEMACPRDNQRNLAINPAAQASTVDALKGLFQDSSKISEQYDSGVMGMGLGFTWRMDQNVASRTVGPLGGSPTVRVLSVDGDSTLSTQAWTSAAASRLKKGDVFTIGSVNAVNPQSRVSTGSLQQFTVTADFSSDSSGNGVVSISPTIQSTGAYQNVDSLPQVSAAITVVGAASTATPQNLAYHHDAFCLGMADLVLPGGVDMAARASSHDSGMSLRVLRSYDIVNDRFPCRIDVMYGWKTLFAELACRIQG